VASEATEPRTQLHGGRLIARTLKAHGVTRLFTLSGGHLFSLYDGCRTEGIELVDVRHEQTAAFAAEGWAKVTRSIGVCALTAGPGVTNGISAIASAAQNGSPMLVLGGRAPQLRWGQGSLQELDHVPFVAPLAKLAATPTSTAEIPALVDEAMRTSLTPSLGPSFLDFPLDYVFMEAAEGSEPEPLPEPWRGAGADAQELSRAATLLRDAERPVIMAGTGLYWGRGEHELRSLAEELQIPVFLNGLGRGCLPADHELFFSRARGQALSGADVAVVIGVPLDFRLAFGAAFAPEAEVIVIDAAKPAREHPRPVAAELYGALPTTLVGLRDQAGDAGLDVRQRWISSLRALEQDPWDAARPQLEEGKRISGKVVRLQPFGACPGVGRCLVLLDGGLVQTEAVSEFFLRETVRLACKNQDLGQIRSEYRSSGVYRPDTSASHSAILARSSYN